MFYVTVIISSFTTRYIDEILKNIKILLPLSNEYERINLLHKRFALILSQKIKWYDNAILVQTLYM